MYLIALNKFENGEYLCELYKKSIEISDLNGYPNIRVPEL